MQARVLITGVLVSFLLSCGQTNEERIGSSTSTSSNSNRTQVGNPDVSSSPFESSEPSVPSVESEVTVAEAAQLTPGQVQELLSFAQQSEQMQLGREFRIIVPTYIPPGFQVDHIDVKIDNRRFWNDYTVSYKNNKNGSCFDIKGTSGGWGGGPVKTEDIKVYSEALGIVILSITISDNTSDDYKIFLKESVLIRNERGYSFSSSTWKECKVMELQDAVKVVESLQYMDSPQTKAKSIETIRKDADKLTAKFDFPLEICGDKASENNEQWFPVFIDGTYLDTSKQYCKYAISKEQTEFRFEKVQVGSFTSYERALELAKAVGGRVGKPSAQTKNLKD